MFGSSEVYRSRPDVLGRSARGPARTFSDVAPGKGLTDYARREKSLLQSLHHFQLGFSKHLLKGSVYGYKDLLFFHSNQDSGTSHSSSMRSCVHDKQWDYVSDRIKELAVHRRNRLNEANTMHQFLRDIDDEEAWIK